MSIIIRLQNLPWSANAENIRQFFSNLVIPDGGVHIVGGEHGDAFIAFGSDEDARQAMAKDGGDIKGVKVRLLLSSRVEMQKVIDTARQQALTSQNLLQTLSTVQQHLQYDPAAATLPVNIPPNLLSALPGLVNLPGLNSLPMMPNPTMPNLPALPGMPGGLGQLPFPMPVTTAAAPVTNNNKLTPAPSVPTLPRTVTNAEPADKKKESAPTSHSQKSKSRSRSRSSSRSRDRRSYRDKYRSRDGRSGDRKYRRDRSKSRDRDKKSERSRSRDRYRRRSRSRERRNDDRSRDYRNRSKERRRDSDRSSAKKDSNSAEVTANAAKAPFKASGFNSLASVPLPGGKPAEIKIPGLGGKSMGSVATAPISATSSPTVDAAKSAVDLKAAWPGSLSSMPAWAAAIPTPPDRKLAVEPAKATSSSVSTPAAMSAATASMPGMPTMPTMPNMPGMGASMSSLPSGMSYSMAAAYSMAYGGANMYGMNRFPMTAQQAAAMYPGYPMGMMTQPNYGQFQPAAPAATATAAKTQAQQPEHSEPKDVEPEEHKNGDDDEEEEEEVDCFGRVRKKSRRPSYSPEKVGGYENGDRYDRRDSYRSRGDNSYNRPHHRDSYNQDDNRFHRGGPDEGGFRKQPYKRGFDRRDGGGDERPRGGFDERPRGSFEERPRVGFNRRNDGPGGFDRRNDGPGGFNRHDNSRGGFDRHNDGSGGFDRRNNGSGGFDRRNDNSGGFDRRNDGSGGFDRRTDSSGGFDRRTDGSAGFDRRNDNSGGFDRRNDSSEGFDRRTETLGSNRPNYQSRFESGSDKPNTAPVYTRDEQPGNHDAKFEKPSFERGTDHRRPFSRLEGGDGSEERPGRPFKSSRFDDSQDPPAVVNSADNGDNGAQTGQVFQTCVEVRNIAPDVTEQDIKRFFDPLPLYDSCIKFQFKTHPGGSSSTSILVKFVNVSQRTQALQLSGKFLKGQRTLILECDQQTFEQSEDMGVQLQQPYLKLTFVPKRATPDDIANAFTFPPDEVVIIQQDGRESLEAYLKFADTQPAEDALKHKDKMLICNSRVKLSAVPEAEFNEAKKTAQASGTPPSLETPSGNYVVKNAMDESPAKLPVENAMDESQPKLPVIQSQPSNDDSAQNGPANPAVPTEVANSPPLTCIRFNSLPLNVTDKDIVNFLKDVEVHPIRIHMMYTPEGTMSGEAFCEFVDEAAVHGALQKDRCLLNHHIIEMTPISLEELTTAVNDVPTYDDMPNFNNGPEPFEPPMDGPQMYPGFGGRGRPFMGRGGPRRPFGGPHVQFGETRGRGLPRPMGPAVQPGPDQFGRPGCVVSLENVPYKAQVEDIMEFFGEFNVDRSDVIRRYNEYNLATGDARVSLHSPADAMRAAKMLDGQMIFDRYITVRYVR